MSDLLNRLPTVNEMDSWKTLARDWFPPAVWRLGQRLRHAKRDTIWFEGDFLTWEDAAAQCTGYDAANILAKVLDATLKVKHGDAACERDSVLFDHIEYSWPVTAGLMSAASRNGGRLNVLDFGGALGASYFQNRRFLQILPEVRWNIVEQAHYVEAGQAHVQDDRLKFYTTIDECVSDSRPDVVLLSGVLQCVPDPHRTLASLLGLRAGTVILDRTPFLDAGDRDRIAIQHVPASIYQASYPCRFFVERHFREFMEQHDYRLLEEFPSLDRFEYPATWKGHIWCIHG